MVLAIVIQRNWSGSRLKAGSYLSSYFFRVTKA